MQKSKSSTLLLILMLTQFAVFGQYNFRPGYSVNLSGDTSNILIDHQIWNISPTSIKIKKSLEAPIETMNLTNLNYFEVGNEVYCNKTVAVNTPSVSFEYDEVPKSPDPVFEKRRAFIRKYVSGKINLYILDDFGGLKHYYAQKGNDSLIPLTYVRYIDTTTYQAASTDYIYNNSLYKYTLADMMKNRPDMVGKIGKMDYSKRDFVEILKDYNGKTFSLNLIDRGPVPEHLVPSYEFYVQPGFIAGITRTIRKNNDLNSDQNTSVNNYDPANFTPQFGLSLNMFSEKNPFIAFYSEFIIQQCVATANYILIEEAGSIYSEYNDVVDQLNLVPLIAARFQPRINNKARLYVFLGLNYNVVLKNSNQYDEVHHRYGYIKSETHTSNEALQGIGGTTGLGIAFKNLSMDLRAFRLTSYRGLSVNVTYNLNGETPKLNK